jgi:dienelactone hydrolase
MIKNKFKQAKAWIKAKLLLVKPGQTSIKGAAVGLLIGSIGLMLLYYLLVAFNIRDPWAFLLGILMIGATILAAFISVWLLKLIFQIPKWYKIALLIAFPLFFMIYFGEIKLIGWSILLFSLLGAVWFTFSKTSFKALRTPKKVVFFLGTLLGIAGLGLSIYYYSVKGLEMDKIENAALYSDVAIPHIPGESPAKAGSYKVLTLTYGSGKDRHRPEFGEEVTFKTDSVNGVAFLDNWKGFGGWWREKYWGFDSKALPINGRVWYPEGDGPFPLVLVVHGNHSMQDFSDPGYDYLGELLASRGMILVSVDENFINGSWSDMFGGLQKENDARGWLLLEHLKVWEQWNASDEHLFAGTVDMDRISLMGHSRGGEAVAHAAMLNELDFYPDDATIPLGYHFNIRSIVSIAPVDGQYQPGNTRTKIKDIDYFVFHGSQDADVTSFMGSMQFERVTFEDSAYHFKTGLYIQGANHGQFNTSWGDNDIGNPFKGLLNLEQQLDAASQQEIAKVYISAFLEATLNAKKEFLPLFLDARAGKNWLPETIYLSQFEDSNTRYLTDFNTDFDVVTDGLGGKISGENLKVWREGEIDLKEGKKGTRAVFLGWNYEIADSLKEETVKEVVADSLIASYSIFPDFMKFQLDSTSVFVFEMAESKESSNPKTEGKWVSDDEDKTETNKEEPKKEDNSNNSEVEEKDEEVEEEKEPEKSLDLRILMRDTTGNQVSFLLSEFSALQRQIKVNTLKSEFLEGEGKSEIVFQKYVFDLDQLGAKNPDFDPYHISEIRFVFDQIDQGVVVLDKVGFSKKIELVEL